MASITLHTGTLAHLRGDPWAESDALEIIPGGALAVDGAGCIAAYGESAGLRTAFPDAAIADHGSAWLIPGLIDAHLHFPQFYATAAPGRNLLDWLEHAIFPAEAACADAHGAAAMAERFVARLLACGTTTAAVFGSQFYPANVALFEAADRAGLHLIAGMTLMDRGGPAVLLQTPEQAIDHMERLAALCAGKPRLCHAVTPRFAPSCSPAMLAVCGEFLRDHPDSYLQTHINESPGEIEAARAAFPGCRHYLDVYDRHGLIGPRSLLAHSIHSSPDELARMAEAGCAVCHCPTSNLYLGSGLFPLRHHLDHGIPVAVGTDIGAGTHCSVWRELAEVYKVQQMQGLSLDAAQLLYLATLGAARALAVDGGTGNFAPGKSADFCVLDPEHDDYLPARLDRCDGAEARLFCLLQLADERHVSCTYVQGTRATRIRPS